MTESSTLAILLLLGVVAGAFVTFGNSASAGGLKISGNTITFSSSGFLAASSLASAGSAIGSFGTIVDSWALRLIGAACSVSAVKDVPSLNFGNMVVSMYLGRWVKTLIFLPFGATEMAEAVVFLFFPCFRVG
jgi:hypothetical protein